MKRRDFLKSSFVISALGAALPKTLIGGPKRSSLKTTSLDSDKIIVLVKLNGGNDGLNTIISHQDPLYYQLRPTIGIPNNQSIPITDSLALHPALEPLLPFYQNSQMSIIQNVGYPNGDLSHFRSSDIWDTGSSEDEELFTGWIGRFLEAEYPGFPENSPEFPLAIQFNSANLLEFKSSNSNMALYLYDPDTMYSIITGNYINDQENEAPDTYGGDELNFLREMDLLSFEYSQIINETAENAPNTVLQYPNTSLGQQFEITARLIAGGLPTPIYRLSQNGYDTHIDQVGSSPSTTGRHSTLLSELSDSLSIFLSEMDALGVLDKVLVVTTSEFGRRAFENASLGTDHGTSAPTLIFGSDINGGIFGENPNYNQIDVNGNMEMEFDYRQIYSTLMTRWFGTSESITSSVFGGNFSPIPFLNQTVAIHDESHILKKFKLHPAYPNPFNPSTTISFNLPSNSIVKIRLFDLNGKQIQEFNLGQLNSGSNEFILRGNSLPSGPYLVQVKSDFGIRSQKVMLIK